MYAQMLPVSEACALLLSLRMPSQTPREPYLTLTPDKLAH